MRVTMNKNWQEMEMLPKVSNRLTLQIKLEPHSKERCSNFWSSLKMFRVKKATQEQWSAGEGVTKVVCSPRQISLWQKWNKWAILVSVCSVHVLLLSGICYNHTRTVLYCNVMYYNVLYCTLLYFTVPRVHWAYWGTNR